MVHEAKISEIDDLGDWLKSQVTGMPATQSPQEHGTADGEPETAGPGQPPSIAQMKATLEHMLQILNNTH